MAMVFQLRDVIKDYGSSGSRFRLAVPELLIRSGEKIALEGESGCGKSTLLDLLALASNPSDAQTFHFHPKSGETADITRLWAQNDRNGLGNLRKGNIGYVLQRGRLLPFLTVRENIALPCLLLGQPADSSVACLAKFLGITKQLAKSPGSLSVGERQRVAIARALVHEPAVVIADEPTAALDPINAKRIMALLMELAEKKGITVIIASHDWNRIGYLGFRRFRSQLSQNSDGTTIEGTFSEVAA